MRLSVVEVEAGPLGCVLVTMGSRLGQDGAGGNLAFFVPRAVAYTCATAVGVEVGGGAQQPVGQYAGSGVGPESAAP